jgi:hypothetical protein
VSLRRDGLAKKLRGSVGGAMVKTISLGSSIALQILDEPVQP